MPFTENFAELRFGGPSFSNQETWSCGLKLKQLGGDSPTAMQSNILATLDQVEDAVIAYFQDPNASFNGGMRLQWIRFNVISAATGKYFYPNNPIIREIENPIAPPGPINVAQIAYAVTLRGTQRRGPGSRGRWFVPVGIGASSVTSTGVMPENAAIAFADAAGTFLSALADTAGPGDLDQWSPWLYGDGVGGASDSAVATVSVGNVYDTQRRRRNQLEETYYDATTYDPTN